jgi:hypothetical protein
MYIIDYRFGVRLKDEEQICKEKSVSVLSVWVQLVPFLYFILISVCHSFN